MKCRISGRNSLMIFILGAILLIYAQFNLPNKSSTVLLTSLNNATLDDTPYPVDTSDSTSATASGRMSNKSVSKPVPRIIHQTYASEMIHNAYKPFIHGCLIQNSNWRYYLWRDADIEALIQDHYPWLMNRYRKLSLKIERGDLIRYIALHHYGGIYLDMDIQCVRPLFPILESVGPVFFDQEREEQAHMIYGHKATVMNSAIGSVPGHPFLLKLLSAINTTASNAEAPLWTTGPLILTAVFNNWTKGHEQAKNPVLLLKPEVFSPIMDGGPNYYLPKFCSGVDSKPVSQLTRREQWVKKGCDMTRSKNWKQDNSNPYVTVGRHMFNHLGWFAENFFTKRFDIRVLHPAVQMYKVHQMKANNN